MTTPEPSWQSKMIHSYQNLVAAKCLQQPYLQNLSNFLTHSHRYHNPSRIACLEFTADSMPRHLSLSLDGLAQMLQNSRRCESILGQILILEDLTRDAIEILGSSLQIDPLFFASFLRTSRVERTADTPGPYVLPSRAKNCDFIHIPYTQPLKLHEVATPCKLLCNANVRRKARVSHTARGSSVGYASRGFSILMRVESNKSWLCEKTMSLFKI
jgi:hypothetical protein